MKALWIFLWGLSFSVLAEGFFVGNQLYDQARYLQAITSYKAEMRQSGEDFSTLYNLAHAHYREGDLAEAIFYTKKALLYSPRSLDAQSNLDFLRSKVKNSTGFDEGFLEKSVKMISYGEILWVFAIISLLFFIASVFSFKKSHQDFVKKLKWVVPLYFFSAMILTSKTLIERREGVVKSEEANVYSGIGRDNVVLFQLSKGSEFQVLKEYQENWLSILTRDGKRGLVKMTDILY